MQPKQDSSALPPPDKLFLLPIKGKETDQDLIDRYNQEYRYNKENQKNESHSSTGIRLTASQLLRSRECRLVMMRRMLATISLLLWALSIAYLVIWVLAFYVWPLHFSNSTFVELRNDSNIYWYVLLVVAFGHTYIVGAWGLLSSFCCQDRCLKRYMLTVPWFLIISITLSYFAALFVKDSSQEKIGSTMVNHMGLYYIEESPGKGSFSKDGWDRTQTFLRCCGPSSPNDWLNSNEKLIIKLPDSCCMNTLGRRERNSKRIDICVKGEHMEMVFPRGCTQVTFEFFTYVGAGLTVLGFSVSLLILLSVAVAQRYYILKRKIVRGKYTYPFKEYLIDFFFIRWCVTSYQKKKAESMQLPTKSVAVEDLENTEDENEISVLFQNTSSPNPKDQEEDYKMRKSNKVSPV